jgi:Ethanolamine utilization protein EutJ (predicted chaperonin)
MNESLVQIQDENFLRKKIYGGTTSVGIRSVTAGSTTYVVDEETGAEADSCSISPIEIE